MAGEIIIYRRWDDCHALDLEFLMGYGPRTPVMERAKLDLRYILIMVSGARICEDSGSTFTLQSPGELSNFESIQIRS